MQSDKLRKGFVEAIQKWLQKPAGDDQVITDVSDQQQLQKSTSVIVKGRTARLKHNDKTDVISAVPSKYNSYLIDYG